MASNGSLKEFVHDAALGAIGAASADAFVEISRFPVVNDPVPDQFQPPGVDRWSVAEAAIYIPSAIAVAVGLLDVIGGKAIWPGFGKHLFGFGAGAILGTGFYETNVSRWLGIRDTT